MNRPAALCWFAGISHPIAILVEIDGPADDGIFEKTPIHSGVRPAAGNGCLETLSRPPAALGPEEQSVCTGAEIAEDVVALRVGEQERLSAARRMVAVRVESNRPVREAWLARI